MRSNTMVFFSQWDTEGKTLSRMALNGGDKKNSMVQQRMPGIIYCRIYPFIFIHLFIILPG